MRRLFGDVDAQIVSFHLVDWREEYFSSTPEDMKGPSAHPSYGLSVSSYSNRLIFIGTETSYTEGGYLEGAIRSIEQNSNLFSTNHSTFKSAL
jgi:monoamine oxidase